LPDEKRGTEIKGEVEIGEVRVSKGKRKKKIGHGHGHEKNYS